MDIYISRDFPNTLIEALQSIYDLQEEDHLKYKLKIWESGEVPDKDLLNSIVLMVDYGRKSLEWHITNHFQEGYRVIACRVGKVDQLDFFEWAITVLRVWPKIIEKSKEQQCPFLYSFNYGGRKLQPMYK